MHGAHIKAMDATMQMGAPLPKSNAVRSAGTSDLFGTAWKREMVSPPVQAVDAAKAWEKKSPASIGSRADAKALEAEDADKEPVSAGLPTTKEKTASAIQQRDASEEDEVLQVNVAKSAPLPVNTGLRVSSQVPESDGQPVARGDAETAALSLEAAVVERVKSANLGVLGPNAAQLGVKQASGVEGKQSADSKVKQKTQAATPHDVGGGKPTGTVAETVTVAVPAIAFVPPVVAEALNVAPNGNAVANDAVADGVGLNGKSVAVGLAGTKRAAKQDAASKVGGGEAKAADKQGHAGMSVDNPTSSVSKEIRPATNVVETAAGGAMVPHLHGLEMAHADGQSSGAVQVQTVAGSAGGTQVHDGKAGSPAVVSGAAEQSLPGHQILSAGPRQLEVGVMDGTHGWLQIRAELGTGGAIATSVTGSAAAHEPLRQSVPEMTSYLASEAVTVSGIAVHKAEAATMPGFEQGQSGGQTAANGAGAGTNTGAEGGRSGGQGARGENGQAGTGATPPIGLGWLGGISSAVFAQGFGSSAVSPAGTGSWLSVRV
jgi:hypothetical protein